jgi:hypothetical protein
VQIVADRRQQRKTDQTALAPNKAAWGMSPQLATSERSIGSCPWFPGSEALQVLVGKARQPNPSPIGGAFISKGVLWTN